MTIAQIYEDAKRKLDKNEITIGEFSKIVDREYKEPNKWTPCNERLPKENEYVGDVCKYYLIQDEYGDMYVAHLSSVGWIPINLLKAIGDEVVAWQPLPKRYRAESEDKK